MFGMCRAIVAGVSDYLESAEGVVIDRARALKELRRHGRSIEQLEDTEVAEFDEMLASGTCDAAAMLRWLGY
jgi:hypothetical protein